MSGASFTKLFSSITESTVWGESHATRIVWITMLAMADSKGRIYSSIPGLANRARVTLEEAEHALERFLAPDRYSRTPDNDGRRIEPMDGGWRLLNYAKYREMRDGEARKEYMREYMQDRRKQEKLTVSQSKPPLAKAEAEEEEEKKKKQSKGEGRAVALPDWLPAEAWSAWLEVRAKNRAPNTPAALRLALKELAILKASGQDPQAVLERATTRGWRGLFAIEGGKPAIKVDV